MSEGHGHEQGRAVLFFDMRESKQKRTWNTGLGTGIGQLEAADLRHMPLLTCSLSVAASLALGTY